MSATRWERSNTLKSTVTWKSGSTYVDPSSNISTLYVYRPDDTLYMTHSGTRDSTGIYHYYVSTSSTDQLGLWRFKWKALFSYSPQNYLEKTDTEVVEMVEVIQS